MTNFVFLDLLGGVSLLVWRLHMVRSGIVRAFGSDLRRLLGTALRNRMGAFLAGLAVTAVLQSSTATALMTASFAAEPEPSRLRQIESAAGHLLAGGRAEAAQPNL
jgi:phosphate:Na+ symporter